MQIFRTDDHTVTKFVHHDGSETAIKCVPSQSTFWDRESAQIETHLSDRQKYSLFISSSTGCYMACKFCHLTTKGSVYRKLDHARVLANLKEALTAELTRAPELALRYIKVCWMGMGDALNQPVMVRELTLELLDWVMAQGFAKGLDGVDVSSVLPKVSDRWIEEFARLNEELGRFPLNPESGRIEQAQFSTKQFYVNRSRFRLFFSLHSSAQATREIMVPNATPLAQAIPLLKRFADTGCDLLLHQLFVQGLNDSAAEAQGVVDFMAAHFPHAELRILRYNADENADYREWPEIEQAFALLAQNLDRLKVQESAGSQVSAACGQFLVTQPRILKRAASRV
jgi:adenine C2-methylase RlmN of 23S rRNA A2503 and tRNA A37